MLRFRAGEKPTVRRNVRSSAVWIAAFLLYFLVAAAPAAHAYIDPGTGSYVFQVVVGAILGAAVAIKVFWRRIWGFLTRRSVKVKDRAADAE
jgi:hypothetical protein